MNAQFVCIPLYKEFDDLFTSTFPSKVLVGLLCFGAFHITSRLLQLELLSCVIGCCYSG